MPTAREWGERYERSDTPWDLGRAHPELEARLAADALGRRRLGHGVRCVVPGCGRGHDAVALARAGWRVTGLDVVAELAAPLRKRLEPLGGRFLLSDALDYLAEPPYELLWEHTFFCALPPEQHGAYGEMARRLVAYRGMLHALLFPVDRPEEEGGPPWPCTPERLQEALGEGFELLRHEPVSHAGPGRSWAEEYAVFRRLDTEVEVD